MRRIAFHGNTRAKALILTLAFVVLVTAAVLAFFSVTQNSLLVTKTVPANVALSAQVKTATESIIGDLRKEMLAGAEKDDDRTDYETFQPLEVTRRQAMTPAPVISENIPPTGFESLIKQSLRNKRFYPGSNDPNTYVSNGPADYQGLARASSINSSQRSLNGRILSPARWDAVGLNNSSIPSSALPDWIYVTRSGTVDDGSSVEATKSSDSNLGNADFVTGRFAYNIYDVGGLLNANAAGFPSTDPSQAAYAARKGGIPWIDLKALGLSEDQIRKLVDEFRNPETIRSNFSRSMNYKAESAGFLKPLTNDGFFYTRQDLLRFFLRMFQRNKLTDCSAEERQIITSLVHGNRFSTAPSWKPSLQPVKALAAGGNDLYGDDEKVNPSVVKLKVLAGKEFTRLRFGDPETFTNAYEVRAIAGDPLVDSRFPLDRLRLITRNAISANTASPIYRSFGIRRGLVSEPWVYDHGDGSRILTLEEVQKEGREPDMVELLKAAILVGSLGKSAGAATAGGLTADLRDRQVDRQVIQIFANIVDQTTQTGFPTHLQFAGEDFYGIKNLPYLTRIKTFLARLLPDSEPFKSGDPYAFGFIPEVWNPHDPGVNKPAERPTRFRVVADSGGLIYDINVDRRNNDSWQKISEASFSLEGGNYLDLADSVLDATEPVLLKSPTLATPGAIPTGLGLTNITGIFAPPFQLDYAPADTAYISQQFNFRYVIRSPGITFGIEYFDPLTSKWERYITKTVDNSPNTGKTFAHRGKTGTNEFRSQNNSMFFGIDPRTDRFATYRIQERQIRDNNWRDIAGAYFDNESLRPDAGTGHGSGTGHLQDPDKSRGWFWTHGSASLCSDTGGYALATVLQNKEGYATYYADADGVVRPGDGFLASGSGKEGQMYWPGNYASRPIVLNRPFRSVAEMGYAFRDIPGRTLDFFSSKSGDSALLDFFTIYETSDNGVTAGRVSANTKKANVVEALLRGVLVDETGAVLNQTRAKTIADAYVARITEEPLLNRAELVTHFLGNLPVEESGDRIKRQREAIVRALGDAMETRTWNLLIDLVVQTGRIPPGKTNLADFQVEGEKHEWIHLSIDRFTGRILSLQEEAVYD